MTKSLEEIIASVNPEALRASLENKRGEFERALADSVAGYEIERANPLLKGEAKKDMLAEIAEAIRKWQWAIDHIDERLKESEEALHDKPNRATRRRKAREG